MNAEMTLSNSREQIKIAEISCFYHSIPGGKHDRRIKIYKKRIWESGFIVLSVFESLHRNSKITDHLL